MSPRIFLSVCFRAGDPGPVAMPVWVFQPRHVLQTPAFSALYYRELGSATAGIATLPCWPRRLYGQSRAGQKPMQSWSHEGNVLVSRKVGRVYEVLQSKVPKVPAAFLTWVGHSVGKTEPPDLTMLPIIPFLQQYMPGGNSPPVSTQNHTVTSFGDCLG